MDDRYSTSARAASDDLSVDEYHKRLSAPAPVHGSGAHWAPLRMDADATPGKRKADEQIHLESRPRERSDEGADPQHESSGGSKAPKRASQACLRCRKQKLRCLGGWPCKRCQKNKSECDL